MDAEIVVTDERFTWEGTYWVYPDLQAISYGDPLTVPEEGLPATGEQAALIEAGWRAERDLHVIDVQDAHLGDAQKRADYERLVAAILARSADALGIDASALGGI